MRGFPRPCGSPYWRDSGQRGRAARGEQCSTISEFALPLHDEKRRPRDQVDPGLPVDRVCGTLLVPVATDQVPLRVLLGSNTMEAGSGRLAMLGRVFTGVPTSRLQAVHPGLSGLTMRF